MSVPQRPRPEVSRSRRLILDAAERLFADVGLEFSLNDLAHEAGVGVATVYRRFPTHDDVVRALYERTYEAFVAVFDALEDAPDGWAGIVGYLERSVAMMNAHPAFAAAARRMARIDPASTLGHDLEQRLNVHVERAKQQGDLRADVMAVDLVTMVAQLGVLSVFPEPARTMMSARQLSFLLPGLRVHTQMLGGPADPIPTTLERLQQLAVQESFAGRADTGPS